VDLKKIDGYPHDGYPTDMGTGTGRIFIQRVGYGGATIRTLPAPLTSLFLMLIVCQPSNRRKFPSTNLFSFEKK